MINHMTAKELAAMIDGREYGYNIFSDVRGTAKQSGLVIVYGASDDLMEIDGAILDEEDVYGGGTVNITADGVFKGPNCDCGKMECEYYREAVKNAKKVRAVWRAPNKPAWTYETDIPHETFHIMEDDVIYCEGIVFSMEDLQ